MTSIISIFKDPTKDWRDISSMLRYQLADISYKSLPPILKRDHAITLKGRLKRGFLETGQNKFIEINIWGQGERDGESIEIIGEARIQLNKRDANRCIQTLKTIEPIINKPIVPLLVTYQTSPDVRRYVQGKNIALYFSYQL
ncbi:MAG: hypothetical protein ACYDHG_14145 [Desulfomonilaceae bacterium]